MKTEEIFLIVLSAIIFLLLLIVFHFDKYETMAVMTLVKQKKKHLRACSDYYDNPYAKKGLYDIYPECCLYGRDNAGTYSFALDPEYYYSYCNRIAHQ